MMKDDENTDTGQIEAEFQENTCLALGSVLNNGTYRIIRVLAQGGFGITYLAENLRTHQSVAIKEYYKKEWHTRDSTTSYVSKNASTTNLEGKFRKKFEKEAHTIMRLNHPNIVKVFEFFEENGTLYYSMEYIVGCSLSDYIKKRGCMTEKESIPFIRKIAETLGYIHAQNELHLDITPRNIMMAEGGAVKLIDFGVSKHYTEDGNQSTSTPVAHSDGYAPKEQYLSEGLVKFSPTTDVYGLAATLYFMLTATTPPNANDRQQCLEEGRELLKIPLSLSENVRNAISWGMSISRKDRLQDTKEFVRTIDGSYKRMDSGSEEKQNRIEIDLLVANKEYKEAYNLCIKSIRNNINVSYARETIEKILPIIKKQSKRENKRQIVITSVIAVIFVIVMAVVVFQMSQH